METVGPTAHQPEEPEAGRAGEHRGPAAGTDRAKASGSFSCTAQPGEARGSHHASHALKVVAN